MAYIFAKTFSIRYLKIVKLWDKHNNSVKYAEKNRGSKFLFGKAVNIGISILLGENRAKSNRGECNRGNI